MRSEHNGAETRGDTNDQRNSNETATFSAHFIEQSPAEPLSKSQYFPCDLQDSFRWRALGLAQ